MDGNQAFTRAKIDAQPKDACWRLKDRRSARYEHPLEDGRKVGYVPCDRRGKALAVLQAKRASRPNGPA